MWQSTKTTNAKIEKWILEIILIFVYARYKIICTVHKFFMPIITLSVATQTQILLKHIFFQHCFEQILQTWLSDFQDIQKLDHFIDYTKLYKCFRYTFFKLIWLAFQKLDNPVLPLSNSFF